MHSHDVVPRLPVPQAETSVSSGVYFVQPTSIFDELWPVLRRRWLLATVVVLTLTACVVASLAVIAPRYRATAQVMIQARKSEVVKVDPVLGALPNDLEVVTSEIQVVQSRDLMARLVRDLALDQRAEFDPNQQSAWRTALAYGAGVGTPWLPSSVTTLLETVATRKLDGESKFDAVVDEAMRHLEVTQVGRSRVIAITFSSTDRLLASTAANLLSALYVENQGEIKQRAAEQANRWLGDNLSRLAETVARAAQKVADFKAQNGLVDGKDSTLISQEISELDTQLTTAKVQRISLGTKLETVAGAKAETSSYVLASPIIQELRKQQAALAAQNTELAASYGTLNPRMQATNAQMSDISARIVSETQKIVASVRTDYKAALDHERALQEQLDMLKARAVMLNGAEVKLRQLEEEERADRAIYNNFLQRSKETGQDNSFQTAEAVMISRAAAPLVAYFPNPRIMLPVGIAAAVVFACLLVIMLEAGDRGFRNQSQIEKTLGVRTIGIVPEFRRERQATNAPDPMSLMGSSMTDIFMRTCLCDDPKTMLIASALPREGKTMVGLMLARVAAMNGKRVLLLDADLRRSGLCRRLHRDGYGLADVLAGHMTLAEVTIRDGGIDIVTSGSAVNNPAGLLVSRTLRDLLDKARSHYDLVIIDSPAIMAGPDAMLLSKVADETLMFVRWARTSRQVVNAAYRRLIEGGGTVSGAVLSRIDMKRIGRYSMTDAMSYTSAMRRYYPAPRRAA